VKWDGVQSDGRDDRTCGYGVPGPCPYLCDSGSPGTAETFAFDRFFAAEGTCLARHLGNDAALPAVRLTWAGAASRMGWPRDGPAGYRCS